LRLLREFRDEFRAFRTMTEERFDEITRLLAGETVLGRYAAADVEKRLNALESRVASLEKTR
jgi:hypothetical protein